MNTLVVYYSRSGNTKKVAVALSRILGSDIEEVIDTTDRSGIVGWLNAGRDGFLKKLTKINKVKRDPKKYKVVIIGTPVWVSVTPAIRTYMTKMKKKFKKVAFFCTKGGTSSKNTYDAMKKLCGKHPVATLDVKERDIRSGEFFEKAKKFSAKIKAGV